MRALGDDAIHVHWLEREPAEGRAPLLALIGAYLDLAPEAVPLVQAGAHAKPELSGAASWLRFNWSHSGKLAVVALARGCDPGVDVEHERPTSDALAIAARFFAASERLALAAREGNARHALFARIWTIKEAVLKAEGRGLAHGLARIVVDADAAEPKLLGVADAGPPWQLHALEAPAPGLHACLAWRGAPRRVEVFRAL